jgi:hypothetical protein
MRFGWVVANLSITGTAAAESPVATLDAHN